MRGVGGVVGREGHRGRRGAAGPSLQSHFHWPSHLMLHALVSVRLHRAFLKMVKDRQELADIVCSPTVLDAMVSVLWERVQQLQR